jgi:SSS family solute:Na+ symporter
VALNIALKFGLPDLEFIIRIWIVFVVALVGAALVSRLTGAPDEARTVKLRDIAFATSTLFNVLAAMTVALLVALYAVLW